MVDRRDETDGAEDNRTEGVMSLAHGFGGGDFLSHPGEWTVQEVLDLPEDSHQRTELVDGALIMSPSAGVPHQRAMVRLWRVLADAAEAVGAPVEVLPDVNVLVPCGLLIPDIAILDAQVAARADKVVPAEAVFVVVEVVSPSNRRTDMALKPKVYAEAGIPQYWRVELAPAACITVDELDGGRYVTTQVITAGRPGQVLKPFPVDLDPGILPGPR
ncbi:Uma2 family endonuclease [Yinghuangia soli]|uniref:Uma2 family endonuclease n=1 Tax=Yinghuangia soli TaxID=2908204 RepID=A0AA41U3K8_9ACTN|nr:Uma2 family endonuclease [Yinghuangia soli]MCF2531930.1 Uma2 family endonuclease [Yinghuangia soli]